MIIFYIILQILAICVGGYTLITSKTSIIRALCGCTLIILSSTYSIHGTLYKAIDKLEPVQCDKIVKSNYDHQSNSFNVIYVKDSKERALDGITPVELDSLINQLNK